MATPTGSGKTTSSSAVKATPAPAVAATASRATAASAAATPEKSTTKAPTINPVGGSSSGVGAFSALDATLPLALLPVRIETRFKGTSSKPELWIRIYPDRIHADGHRPGLDDSEVELARQFWQSCWSAGGDEAVEQEAFRSLVTVLGAGRAAYVAGAQKPTNWAAKPVGGRRGGAPTFPTPTARAADLPGVARLLPERWMVAGFKGGKREIYAYSEPIPAHLPVTPDFAASKSPADLRAFFAAQGLTWMIDFDVAVQQGMALKVPISAAVSTGGLDELIVLGVRKSSTEADDATALEALFSAHHYTEGLDFVPAGTPTNNTDATLSGVSLLEPDLNALMKGERLGSVGADKGVRTPSVQTPYAQPFADAAQLALGLGNRSVLGKLSNADHPQLELAGCLNTALWPATWGYMLRTMLPVGLSEETLNWVKELYIETVRGAGPLPAFRVGEQPYGVLPITDPPADGEAPSRLERQEVLLSKLETWWTQAIAKVPRMNPDASDGAATTTSSSGAQAPTTVAQVLASQPDPWQFKLREVSSLEDQYSGRYFLLMVFLDIGMSNLPEEYEARLVERLEGAKTLEQLKTAFTSTRAEVYRAKSSASLTAEEKTAAQQICDYLDTYIFPFIDEHAKRIAPVLALGIDRTEVTGKMDDKGDPNLFFGMYSEEEEAWEGPLVSHERAAEDVTRVEGWLSALATEAGGGAKAVAPTPNPMLFQLLQRSIQAAKVTDSMDEKKEIQASLQALIPRLTDGSLTDPLGELERLCREAVGLASHRIDAWFTGIAARRLANLRQKKRTGLQVGAYGWVLNLKPSKQPSSQGFIHAPSLSHASTAAVLRSGWSALGEGAQNAPLSIDVSSERVRRAQWLLDGVREGQSLERLLGYQFERRLHDANLDVHVEPIRKAVLEAQGRGQRPPTGVVDGLVLSRAFAESGTSEKTSTEAAVRTAVDKAIGSASTAAKVRAVLSDLVNDLDAVADSTLTQSVHALLMGNTARASAALSSLGSGEATPPQLEFARTRRSGQQITHRLMVILPGEPQTPSLWPGSDRALALAEPLLERWIGAQLGDPSRYTFALIWRGDTGTELARQTCTLAELNRCALEILYALPGGLELEGSQLDAWILQDAERRREALKLPVGTSLLVDYAPQSTLDGNGLTLRELHTVAHTLHHLVHAGRALDTADLAMPGVEVASTQRLDELQRRATAVRSALSGAKVRFASALSKLQSVPTPTAAQVWNLLSALEDVQAFHLSGAEPDCAVIQGALAGDSSQLTKLLAGGQTLLERLDARLKETAPPAKGEDVQAVIQRLRTLVGQKLPVLPLLTAPDAAVLEQSLAAGPARLGADPLAAQSWLQKVAHVQPGARTLAASIDLVDAVHDASKSSLRVVQLPHVDGEGWVAISAAKSTDSRLCLTAWMETSTGFYDGTSARPIAGLLLDSWTEAIPDTQVSTGLSVHFDAPGACPPQTLLLGVLPVGDTWSYDRAVAMVRRTLQLAKVRSVGPELLDGPGQFLPALYLSSATDPGEAPKDEDA